MADEKVEKQSDAADRGWTSDGPPEPPEPTPAPPRPDGHGHLQGFEKPVAWLFGRQLIRSIKGILLYSAFTGKLDPRDWMTATSHSFRNDADNYAEPWPADQANYPDGFWFDYISDTGDGMRATYSIAYLCLSNISVPTADPKRLKAGASALPVIDQHPRGERDLLPRGEFLFIGGDTAYHASDYMTLVQRIQTTFNWAYDDLKKDGGIEEPDAPRPIFGIPGNHDYYDQLDGFRRQFHRPVLWEPRPPKQATMDRPEHFDVSDTAQLQLKGFYRSQDASYLALRLPFGWEMWGLDTETGQIDERQKDFFRQFCDPPRTSDEAPRREIVVPPKRLIVATCSPTTFFGKLANPKDFKSADAFGQLGIPQPFLPDKKKEARTLGKAAGIPYDLTATGDARLAPGQCRLDLSGDVHHYARYWGPEPPDRSETPREREDEKFERPGHEAAKRDELKRKNQPRADSYASVVSGIGGAFHHPSETYFGEVREQSLYPSEPTSTDEVSRHVFSPVEIAKGGYVWLAGAVIAFIIYFSISVPQSSREALNNLPHLGLGLASSEVITPTTIPTPKATPAPESRGAATAPVLPSAQTTAPEPVRPFLVRVAELFTGAQPNLYWLPPGPCKPGVPRYFFGPCRAEGPWDFWLGIIMAIVSAVPLLIGAFYSDVYHKKWRELIPELVKKLMRDDDEDDEEEPQSAPAGPGVDVKDSQLKETAQGTMIMPAQEDPETKGEPFWRLWLLYGIACVLFFGGLAMAEPYRQHITPFGSSLLVLLSFVWAGACVAFNIRYTDFLYKKAEVRTVTGTDWRLTWFLGISAVVAVAFGLWSFGYNNLPALLVSDIVFIAAMGILAFALIYALPFAVTDALFGRWPKSLKWPRRLCKLLIGLWHFLLQLAVPFVLVRRMSLLTLILMLVAIVAGMLAGPAILAARGKLARYRGLVLALVWLVLGALILYPIIHYVSSTPTGGSWFLEPWFATDKTPWFWWPTWDWWPTWPVYWTGWWGIVPSILAFGVGALMCCYWFGWYLGVCFAFNGHNNEVGGAARIERFKQFIRFRLDESGLTGYVIAVNDPTDTGHDLTPHVVDVFHLRPKP